VAIDIIEIVYPSQQEAAGQRISQSIGCHCGIVTIDCSEFVETTN
jgi:hypothetical protein